MKPHSSRKASLVYLNGFIYKGNKRKQKARPPGGLSQTHGLTGYRESPRFEFSLFFFLKQCTLLNNVRKTFIIQKEFF